jgi:hypothetical protein
MYDRLYEDSTMFLLRFVTIGYVFGQFLIVVEAASTVPTERNLTESEPRADPARLL